MKNDQNLVSYEVKPHFRKISDFDAVFVITFKVSRIMEI
jgi:hypothetical protein